MTLSDHSADDIRPARCCIDCTLADVDTSDEECRLEAVFSKLVKHLAGVDVRSIIVSDSDSTSFLASIDTSTSVLNATLLGTGIISSAGSSRGFVCVAGRAIVKEAIRGTAMIRSGTAISLHSSQQS